MRARQWVKSFYPDRCVVRFKVSQGNVTEQTPSDTGNARGLLLSALLSITINVAYNQYHSHASNYALSEQTSAHNELLSRVCTLHPVAISLTNASKASFSGAFCRVVWYNCWTTKSLGVATVHVSTITNC